MFKLSKYYPLLYPVGIRVQFQDVFFLKLKLDADR